MMFYNSQPSPPNNWSSNGRYPNHQSERRLKTSWLLIATIIVLTLSVTALIIVFSVEHSWFHDSFNQTSNYFNYYGLWRLCFYANKTCDSWFSTSGPNSQYIYDRLNYSKVGINAWQALEIVFIFLTTSTLIITIASAIISRFHQVIHYYLAILSVFCVWPAVCIGISALFVFGFSVYDKSPVPHSLDWCFYVNIVAVVLCLIGAILITVYDILLKPPIRFQDDNTITEPFTDLNGYPTAVSPTTYVVVPRNQKGKHKKKRYDYPQVLYPQRYYPNTTPNSEYIPNPNYQMMQLGTQPAVASQPSASPYRTAGLLTSRSSTSVPPPPPPPPLPAAAAGRSYQPPITTYRHQPQPPHWHRTESNSVSYPTEAVNDYIQRGIYRPSRLPPMENRDEQALVAPRILHYYTGYDHFSTVDPSDIILTRHHQSPIRYNLPSYYSQNDYIKSAM